MEQHTESNPGCFHSALKYLSEITGVSQKKEIVIKTLSGLRSKSGKKLLYRTNDIRVVDSAGNTFMYMQGQKRFDACGIIAAHFLVFVNRRLDEFGIEIKHHKDYKDSLGNGWYQMVSCFSINGRYFAYMDCTC